MKYRLLILTAAALSAAIAVSSVHAKELRAHGADKITIEPQSLASALQSFSAQSGLQVGFESQLAKGLQTKGTHEASSADEALSALLAGTGLEYRFVNEQTVVIREKDASRTTAAQSAYPINLAQADQPALSGDRPNDARKNNVEEIIVTAQKRAERLQDVPVPVTALKADVLVERNQLSIKDYFTSVPGLNFQAGNKNEALLSIRGINGALNPTVGVTVDDVPFGSSLFRSGGGHIPDLDPNDLARIEVLRGPQGTLYGVSTLGGLIKYVTIDPSTDRVSGHVQAGVNATSGGDELGYSVRSGINLPLSDTLAVRASGFTRRDAGYIDNPGTNVEDVNRGDAAGGLLSAMLTPSDALSIKLSALYQHKTTDGVNRVDPTLGDLRQTYIRGAGSSKASRTGLSATISGKWKGADLTSLTGYNANRFEDSVDIANAARIAAALANFGVAGEHYTEDYNARKFSQEFRLLTPVNKNVDLLLGGFYTYEKFKFPTLDYAADPLTGVKVGLLGNFDAKGTYEEYAGFADLTVHFTDRFDVQFGGRKSHNIQNFSELDIGVTQLVPGGRLVIPNSVIKESPFTYLVTPRLRISPDLMIYARSASGYRAGGINPAFARGFAVPPGWQSDKTFTYELGAKGSVFDGALSYDASLFYVDWKDLQLNYTNNGVGYTSNGSRAKSQGLELSLETHPLTGMTLGASMSLDEAELTESLVGSTSGGAVGDRLPFASKFAGSVALDQDFPLAGAWTGFIGGTLAYVGDRVGGFLAPGAARQRYPAYTQVDARAGVAFESWRANAYVTNLGNKRGLLGGGIGQSNPRLFNIVQPRTFGLSLSRNF